MKMMLLSQIAAAVIAVASVSTALAETGYGYDVLTENGKNAAQLEHCGGSAHLAAKYVDGVRRPVLMIQGVKNCSKVYINGDYAGSIPGGVGSADIVIYESKGLNVNDILITSGTGKTSDAIRVQSFGGNQPKPKNLNPNVVFNFGFFSSVLGLSQYSTLPGCGGTATVTVVDGEQLRIVFKNVKSCSNFDILGSQGQPVDYPTKDLQPTSKGEFAGSFTIPSKLVDFGANSIKVIVKSNTGKTDDVLLIRFGSY